MECFTESGGDKCYHMMAWSERWNFLFSDCDIPQHEEGSEKTTIFAKASPKSSVESDV